ncbi:uncharacterized protein [Solanum tuberosum]|uniref:uncharacterized protein n=1 Tax=Solanum tuberosum TaxID=4113 RepID=UPI00073A0108|nr:PREDICTED: uncharacterized protein LOC102597768 [Solanum tuberosum]
MHSANHKFDRPGEAEASIQKRRSNNYSQVSDGAAVVLLMKRSIAMQKGLPILGVFREYSGPSLSYYINNFKPMKVVQASAHLPQILCCYSGLDNLFLSFGDGYNTPEDNIKQLEMFDKERIAKLKKGILIVNSAREAIMDTQAVVDACNNGHIAGILT